MTSTESPTLVQELLPDAPYRERHTRTIAAPIDDVWTACQDVTVREIRLMAPLMAARSLPALIRHPRRRRVEAAADDRPLLEIFRAEGFVVLRQDDAVAAGEASLDFGAAGRFWSFTENQPISFSGADDFIELARERTRPGLAITVANLCAVDNGDGTTTVTTETRVDGTDTAATASFGRYWFLIRLGSGAIRRSWLAAIERRVRARV